jgi:hypothetical protein
LKKIEIGKRAIEIKLVKYRTTKVLLSMYRSTTAPTDFMKCNEATGEKRVALEERRSYPPKGEQ